MNFVVIIPARYASSRLPGKPLLDIHGKPMIVHVLERAQQSGAAQVIVATDHAGVADVVRAAGGEVCITSDHHQSGTERLAEVVAKYQFADDKIIVNVQGDEPLIPPVIIRQVAENLQHCHASMATLAVPLTRHDELFNPNVVKVVLNSEGYALYFSRAAVPWDRDKFVQTSDNISTGDIGTIFLRHIGIYGYRAGFIRRYINWSPALLEHIEKLEQLRVLWHGEKIHVALARAFPGTGVDTEDDLQQVRQQLTAQ